jgi:hypothetical protein
VGAHSVQSAAIYSLESESDWGFTRVFVRAMDEIFQELVLNDLA